MLSNIQLIFMVYFFQFQNIQNIPGLGNVQLIPAGTITLGQGQQNVTIQQQGSPNQQLVQTVQSPLQIAGLGNLGNICKQYSNNIIS